LINPLPGYVDNKAGDSENRLRSTNRPTAGALRSIQVGGAWRSLRSRREDSYGDKGHSRLSTHWLLCVPR
jgi:hypothetical protein